jgi:FixJ family two-component response regulator
MGVAPVVAIVDDDATVRAGMAEFMASVGCATELYASAEAFLGRAATSGAVCLILDIQLGGMSGLELGRQLSALGFAFPIIFISGSDDPAHRREATEIGCVAFLRKPFRAELLSESIAQALTRAAHWPSGKK